MLPSAASPNAKPNWPLVSFSAAAEPAFSGGAEAMISWMPRVTSGPAPRKISTNPVARVVGPDVVSV
jgi:hypothetical protein